MDSTNPVIRLCIEGIESEHKGRLEEASMLFMRAWEESTNDFEFCIAAHYVARHQKIPADAFRWNQEALDCANRVNDERVQGFYPSLYLNMGKASEDLGNRENAKQFYELAANRIDGLPDGPYRDIVRDGIERGLRRLIQDSHSRESRSFSRLVNKPNSESHS